MEFKSVRIKNEENKKEVKKSGYYVSVKWIYGDNDESNIFEVGPFFKGNANKFVTREFGPFFKGEENDLIRFVNMLETVLNVFSNAKDDREILDIMDEIPELRRWIEYEIENEGSLCELCEHTYNKHCNTNCSVIEMRINFDWETTSDGWYCDDATIKSYNVIYYDANTDKEYDCVFE